MEALSRNAESGEILEAEREYFDLDSFPEQYRDIAELHRDEFIGILEQTLPAELIEEALDRVVFDGGEPVETNNRYGVKAVSMYETGGTIRVYEGFFRKNFAEQQYILMHEVGHALASVIFSDSTAYQSLAILHGSSGIDGETNYVRHMMELRDNGRLGEKEVFAEQTAERVASYLLGGGDLVNMLEIQAVYLRNPEELFSNIPAEALADKAILRQYLRDNEEINTRADQTRSYHQLIRWAIGHAPRSDNEHDDDWDLSVIDNSFVGSSQMLDSYLDHHQASAEPKTLWAFLLDVLFPRRTP